MDKSQLNGGIDYLIVLIRCNAAVDLRKTAAFIKWGVLAHQAHIEFPFRKMILHPVQQQNGIVLRPGQHHVAYDDSLFHQCACGCIGGFRILKGSEFGRPGLPDHLQNGGRCLFKVVRRLAVAGGQPGTVVFQIGQPDVHVALKGFYHLCPFVAAAVIDYGDRKPGLYEIQGGDDRGEILGGGDEIDIVSAFILKAKKDIAKLPDRELLSQSLLTDGVILAEAAAKGTSGEKYCAASVDSADPRLLPLVKGRPGCHDGITAATEALRSSGAAVGHTAPGTERAGIILGNQIHRKPPVFDKITFLH